MICIPTNRTATPPGVLLHEQIREMGPSVHRDVRDAGLPSTRLHEIVHERRGVSAETAISLATYFRRGPEFRVNAQMAHDLSSELAENGEMIRKRTSAHADNRAAA